MVFASSLIKSTIYIKVLLNNVFKQIVAFRGARIMYILLCIRMHYILLILLQITPKLLLRLILWLLEYSYFKMSDVQKCSSLHAALNRKLQFKKKNFKKIYINENDILKY